MRLLSIGMLSVAASLATGPLVLAQTWPAGLNVAPVEGGRVGATVYPSSSRLEVSWTPPAEAPYRYILTLGESVTGTESSVEVVDTRAVVTGLKSGTTYTVALKACLDEACERSLDADVTGSGRTSEEYWQVQGSGNSFSRATKIVSDGNTAAFVVPYGEWAGSTLNGRAQLYYNPSVGSEKGIKLGEMSGGIADSVAPLSSFRPVSGYGLLQVCQIRPGEPFLCPGTGTSVAATVATFQAVALDAALGGGIRLFFEALGTDHRSRIMYLDSRDGYVGRDFNASGKTICNTLEDYTTGGCIPTVVIAVNGDALARDGNPRLSAARQFKIGYPTRTDWRWGGEPGTFMVITADFDAPCASEAFFNAAYAIWGGRRWVLQYDPSGCPKYMPEVQAPMPVHLGAARYKMYFSHNPLRRGAMSDPLRDLKPLQIIYADGGLTGEPGYVDFEDWEQVAQAREVHFLWPDGSLLELAHESQLDDYMIFMPTGNPSLQIMYSNMATPGSRELPFIGMAVLVNP